MADTTPKSDAEKIGETTPGKPSGSTTKKATKKATTRRTPRKQTTPKKDVPKRGPGRPANPKVDDLVAEAVSNLGAGLYLAGTVTGNDQLSYDGEVLVYNSDALGAAMKDLTDSNPKMAKALERTMTTGKTMRSLLVIGATAAPIAANHGLIPPAVLPFVAKGAVAELGMPPAPPARPAAPVSSPSAPTPPAPRADGRPVEFDPSKPFLVDDPDGPSPQQREAEARAAATLAAMADGTAVGREPEPEPEQ